MRVATGARMLLVASAMATLTSAPAGASSAPVDAQASIVASFEGGSLRLADGWGEAHACTSDGKTARCYRTEAEMDAAEGKRPEVSTPMPLIDCGTSVRLYSSTGYGGDVLQLTTRFVTINLASHGFNNVTSSYRIGSCSAQFYDTTGGSIQYPGSTTAGSSAALMVSGWDNRVGSVYIF